MIAATDDPFSELIGQEAAIARLRDATKDPVHAYLFVGPRGAGKRRAANALAGEWVGDPSERERSRRLAQAGEHPDIVLFEPEGPTLRIVEAKSIIVEASRAPVEGRIKTIVIDRFHDAEPEAVSALLKPIEEPPASTRFVILAEHIPPEHVTVASRATQIDFPAVAVSAITDALIARGIAGEVAAAAAKGSGGDVVRAELLVTDTDFADRRALWWSVPDRLDGSGYVVSEIVAELRAAVDHAQEPLEERQRKDSETMAEIEELTGTRGSGRRAMEVRHKREARLHRTDELRMGLATLAHRYRGGGLDAETPLAVFSLLSDAAAALVRNPNEELWLTGLMLDLSRPTV